MNLYVWLTTKTILRTSDMASIPIDISNYDYREFLTWEAAGNTADSIPTPPVLIPTSVTNYQGRAVLISAGLFDTVNSFVQVQGTNSLEYMAWEYADSFYRDSPFITNVSTALGLTPDQIDQLFIQASKIQ